MSQVSGSTEPPQPPGSNIAALPSIFDRRRNRHPWLAAFQELELTHPTRRLVTENWRMDHRVSPERETEMLAGPIFGGEPDGETWWRLRREHFNHSLCRSARFEPGVQRSAYVEPSNVANSLPHRLVPGHEQLIHVASLNRLLARLSTGEHTGAAALRLRFFDLTGRSWPARARGGLDRDAFQREVNDLGATLRQSGVDAVRRVAAALCDALGDAEPPWWAGFAEEVLPQLDADDATGLCQALGMGHLESGEWLLVWRYEVQVVLDLDAQVGLYRPTVVEANESPFHFPSPPKLRFGVTMPLAGRRGACKEVIHSPLRGTAAATACTGLLLQLPRAVVGYDEIPELRNRHRRRLKRVYPQPETAGWLDRHPPP